MRDRLANCPRFLHNTMHALSVTRASQSVWTNSALTVDSCRMQTAFGHRRRIEVGDAIILHVA
jgi:hypothetical protein